MKVYIIRHGETQWNAQKKLQGASDTQLNEKGIALARETGKALAQIPFSCCFTSPLIRAKETARLILGERDIPVYEDPRIREISFGDWEGRESSELPAQMLEYFFHHTEKYCAPEGGESLEEVCCRTRAFWEDIISRKELREQTILVATHGCAMRALLQNVYENPSIRDFWHGKVPPNCGVNVVEVREGKAFLLEEDVVYYA